MIEVQTVLAPNPGLYTGPGTNTYVVAAERAAVVIDPGPDHAGHRRRVVAAATGTDVVGVLVTHAHPDHALGSGPLAAELDAPVYAYGPGPGLAPDTTLADGDVVELGSEAVTALHTPGHSDDHLCFVAGGHLFAGDVIMGGSTVYIDDLSAYLATLERLADLPLTHVHPGHGEGSDDPRAVIAAYLAHRRAREQQILEAVASGVATVDDIVRRVYEAVDPGLHDLAARSVLAHLRKLEDEGRVVETAPGMLALGPVT